MTIPTAAARALGARLRHIRERNRMSQMAFELLSCGEIKAVTIGSYERGDRACTVVQLLKIAELYQVPITDLIPAEWSAPQGPEALVQENVRFMVNDFTDKLMKTIQDSVPA